jgi:hypothetical protein
MLVTVTLKNRDKLEGMFLSGNWAPEPLPYIFNTNLNPLRSAHFTKAPLSFSSPS